MNWITIESQIRIVGILAFLLIIYARWMGSMVIDATPAGYKNPVLALELAANGAEIDAVNNSKGATHFIQEQLRKDSGFIAVYVVFLSCLALLLTELALDQSKYLGLVAAACAVIAGILDLIENRGMRQATTPPFGHASNELANSIRYPSLAKWALIFVCCLLVGVILLKLRGWILIPGLACVVGGLLGLSGVTANLISPKFYAMFPASLIVLAVGIIFVAVTFTIWPARVLAKFFADF